MRSPLAGRQLACWLRRAVFLLVTLCPSIPLQHHHLPSRPHFTSYHKYSPLSLYSYTHSSLRHASSTSANTPPPATPLRLPTSRIGTCIRAPSLTPKAEAKACCAQPAVIKPDYCVSARAHHPAYYSYTARSIDLLLFLHFHLSPPTTTPPSPCPTNTPMLSLRRPSRTLVLPSRSHSSTVLLVSV